jgi:hypothetical protein
MNHMARTHRRQTSKPAWLKHKGEITKRVIRACALTTTGATHNGKRVTWCATVGDGRAEDGSRWWADD